MVVMKFLKESIITYAFRSCGRWPTNWGVAREHFEASWKSWIVGGAPFWPRTDRS